MVRHVKCAYRMADKCFCTRRIKDKKVGEGMFAVVYQGAPVCVRLAPPRLTLSPGREAATGRKVAIKKIKVGQFKDGLDMSAIREVKYLREMSHPNIINVCLRVEYLSAQRAC